ncbi:MAG: exodeoxyribonuclease V subunit gamma, partial [Deltaproteobacteria bacterium]
MPNFNIYTSNRLEVLAEKLSVVIREPLASPMNREVICVQSRSMQHWLSMELAKMNGVCANVKFVFPRMLIEEFINSILGVHGKTQFDIDVCTWEIMRVLPQMLEQPHFEVVSNFVGSPKDEFKLFQLAQKIAISFDEYLVYRPDKIITWEKNIPQEGNEAWQAMLFQKIKKEKKELTFPELLLFCEQAIDKKQIANVSLLPQRIAIFGISFLPPLYLYALQKMSDVLDINFFAINPCREFWFDNTTYKKTTATVFTDQDDNIYDETQMTSDMENSLLGSLGVMGKSFFNLLIEVESRENVFFDTKIERKSLLANIQADILELHPDRETPQLISHENQKSLTINSCHN